MQAHQGALVGYAFSLLRNLEAAKDEAQLAFIKLSRTDCPGIEKHRAWLFHVCRNSAFRRREREARQQPWSDFQWSVLADDALPDSREAAEHAERLQSLHAALDTLPPRQAEVMRLRYLGGLSAAEIADVLKDKPNNIHQLHHAGLQSLRLRMQPETKSTKRT